MVKKKLLTLDDLVRFCQQNNFTQFSAKESGYQLAVQVPTTFEVQDESDNDHRGMLKLKFRILHDGLNRNGSFVSHKAADKAASTIADRPILAAIHRLDDGSWDFETHNMEIIENDDGEPEINYIEKQVGSFSSEKPFWEHDDELDKDYLCAYGYIAEEYTKAADIIRNKDGWTKNSCELSIEELSYNVKEHCIELSSFYLSASTLLGSMDDGTEIGEGMLGSRADIIDFSEKNNSVFSHNDKVIELLSALNEKLDNLDIKNFGRKEEKPQVKKKFEMDSNEAEAEVKETPSAKFDEDDPNYYEEPTEEPAEDPTEEQEEEPEEPIDEPENPVVQEEEGNDAEEPIDEGTEEETDNIPLGQRDDDDTAGSTKKTLSVVVNHGEATKTFAISLSDKQRAMYELINATYGEQDNDWYCFVEVYEDPRKEVVFAGWCNEKYYRQAYKVKKNEYTLVGDREEVHVMFVNDEEENVIESMRSNYSAIQNELAQYKAEPEKLEVLNSDCYAQIADTEGFKKLSERDTYFSMSVDEVRSEADRQLLEYAKHNEIKFSENEEVKKPSVGMKIFKTTTEKKSTGRSRYGGLFAK